MADDEIQRYVGYGTNLAGALTGAAVGAATTGDPSGAVWGAALGASVEAALAETSHRALSVRRRVRVGAVIVLARETLFASFGKGRMLRSDDFMRERLDGRASVDEVIEHVIQVAEDTYEERKLPHIAAVLANVATSTQVDAATAHWVLTAVRGMSWQKLVAIALIGDQENNPLPELERDEGDTWRSWSAREVFTELYYVDQMIGYGASEEGRPRGPRINDFSLTSKSNLIFHIAELTSISNEQRREFLQALTDEDGERHVTEVEVR